MTSLAFGGAPLGNLFERLQEDEAEGAVREALSGGITLFDTAPWYGHGLSEHRLGHQLRQVPRDDFAISTKVGRVLSPTGAQATSSPNFPWVNPLPFLPSFDYTGSGIRRSYEDSLMRLGLGSVDLLLIHDLDSAHHGPNGVDNRLAELEAGGWDALEGLRNSREVRGIGAGINDIEMIPRLLARFDLDFFLVAMPYTLLDQALLGEAMDQCVERGLGLLIGSPYGSGILATGAQGSGRYDYAPPLGRVVEKVRRLEAVCQRHGVPLRAAALQFPLGLLSVAAVVTGISSVAQVRDNLAMMAVDIPVDLWAELKAEGLVRPDAPTPEQRHR
jgi:D-threo-aldose 1-dehydrogenase